MSTEMTTTVPMLARRSVADQLVTEARQTDAAAIKVRIPRERIVIASIVICIIIGDTDHCKWQQVLQCLLPRVLFSPKLISLSLY